MSDKEIRTVALSIRKNGKEISKDRSKAAAFLKKIGILTKDGNVSNAYKEVCIPIVQD